MPSSMFPRFAPVGFFEQEETEVREIGKILICFLLLDLLFLLFKYFQGFPRERVSPWMKALTILSFALVATVFALPGDPPKPKDGYVPNAETAIKVALAVWEPIYGKEHIEKQKPHKAELKDGIWHVSGSLPEGTRGGTAMAEIAKEDARVLRVVHGQ